MSQWRICRGSIRLHIFLDRYSLLLLSTSRAGINVSLETRRTTNSLLTLQGTDIGRSIPLVRNASPEKVHEVLELHHWCDAPSHHLSIITYVVIQAGWQ